MSITPLHPPTPDHDRDDNPGVGPPEPREPSWSDVIGGIWDRVTHPLPGT
jgi:hypothetical protein